VKPTRERIPALLPTDQTTQRSVIDLTWPIGPQLSVAPEYPAVRLELVSSLHDGDSATAELLTLGLHIGTHVDVPAHFYVDGETVDKIAPLALCGSAVLIDIAYDGEGWREITGADLEQWERQNGQLIAEGDIVLIRSGYGAIWQRLPAGPRRHNRGWPYLGTEALRELVARRIRVVGVDTPDPDRRDPSTNEAHRTLLGAGIYIIEHLANLESIPSPRFDFFALALPFTACTGSPIRALALIQEQTVDA
jgi:arylformamidase